MKYDRDTAMVAISALVLIISGYFGYKSPTFVWGLVFGMSICNTANLGATLIKKRGKNDKR